MSEANAVLLIFTVKKFVRHEGDYFTYGGFGAYLQAMQEAFRFVVLVAHVRSGVPPDGWYRIDDANTRVLQLPVFRYELGNVLSMPLFFAQSVRAVVIGRRESAGRPVLAHARMPDYTGVVGAWVCRFLRVPVLHQVIADWAAEARKMPATRKFGLGLAMKVYYRIYDFLERLTCRGQLVFAQGESCYAKHAPAAEAVLVYSSSHHARDVIASPSSRTLGREVRLLTVGRLTSVKNQALLVRVAAALNRETSRRWFLDILGEGPLQPALLEQIRELGVSDRVRLSGQVAPGSDLWRAYDSSDIFVLPSRSEGTPKVLLEAMARGVPVVAADVGGIPGMLAGGKRGVLFREGDGEDLENRLIRLADDEESRASLVRQGLAFALEHCVESSTAQMLQKVRTRWPVDIT